MITQKNETSAKKFIEFLFSLKENINLIENTDKPFGKRIVIEIEKDVYLSFFFHYIISSKTSFLQDVLLENDILIWENQFHLKPNLIKNSIRYKFRLLDTFYARKTTIKKIDKPVAKDFLNDNHLLYPNVGKYRYALVNNKDEILALIVFSYGRNWKDFEGKSYEILRFCNKNNISVVSGFSKLLKHFIREKNPAHIMTYADKSIYKNSLYEKSGFKRDLNYKNKERTYYISKDQFYFSDKEMENSMKVIDLGNYKYFWKHEN